MLSSCHAHQAKCQKDSRLHSSGSVDKTSVFNVNLANHLENRLLADFLSRKRSKALIYKDVACYGLEDLCRLQLISDCQISPDGEHVVFCVQRVDKKTHKK